jgi:hypothetical protein
MKEPEEVDSAESSDAPDPSAAPDRSDAPDRSAGAPPAVAGATRPRFGDVIIHDRGHLPHWEKDSATYFVTFRLADSLPQSVLERIESERQSIAQTAKQLQRDQSEFERALQYVADNPVKAGLQNWQWVWVGGRGAHPTAGGAPALREPA